jgi:site-specific DNA-cytosine methylase
MAYFLDPDKAIPMATKQSQLQAAKIQGTGYNFGVNSTAAQANQLASQGVSVPEARERFRTVAAEKDDLQRLGDLYGEGFKDSDQVADAFGMDGAEGFQKKKKKLASQERGKFSGTSGIKQGSLDQKKDKNI